MANGAIFFRENNRKYGIGAITFDLLLNEKHDRSSSVTNYNLQSGIIISDHVYNEPPSGELTGLISNFSIYQDGIFSNRAQDVFEQIEILWKKKVFVNITTIYKIYANTLITNFNTKRDDTSGEELTANFSFMQPNIVRFQETQAKIYLSNMEDDLRRQLALKTRLGLKNGENIPIPIQQYTGQGLIIK